MSQSNRVTAQAHRNLTWSEHAAAMIYFPKTQIIALVNQKGYCGKTTSAVAITSAFADLGYSVCLADTDPQSNATEGFGVRAESIVEEGKFTLADAYLKKTK